MVAPKEYHQHQNSSTIPTNTKFKLKFSSILLGFQIVFDAENSLTLETFETQAQKIMFSFCFLGCISTLDAKSISTLMDLES